MIIYLSSKNMWKITLLRGRNLFPDFPFPCLTEDSLFISNLLGECESDSEFAFVGVVVVVVGGLVVIEDVVAVVVVGVVRSGFELEIGGGGTGIGSDGGTGFGGGGPLGGGGGGGALGGGGGGGWFGGNGGCTGKGGLKTKTTNFTLMQKQY